MIFSQLFDPGVRNLLLPARQPAGRRSIDHRSSPAVTRPPGVGRGWLRPSSVCEDGMV